MITNNYKVLLNSFLFNAGGGSLKYGKQIVPEDNSSVYTAFTSTSNSSSWITNLLTPVIKTASSNNAATISFGSGNQEASASDYALGTPIYLLTQIGSTAHELSIEDGLLVVKNIITVKNPTNDSITIKELGLFVRIPTVATQGGSSTVMKHVLIDRTVLETPITLEPDEAVAITYKIKEASS